MSKMDAVRADYLAARKSDNVLSKKLLSTLIGEFDNQSKNADKSGDDLLFTIVKKMIKNAQIVNTEDSKKESEILQSYLPAFASEQDIANFLNSDSAKDIDNRGKLIGLTKTHFNGNVDMALLNKVIDAKLKG